MSHRLVSRFLILAVALGVAVITFNPAQALAFCKDPSQATGSGTNKNDSDGDGFIECGADELTLDLNDEDPKVKSKTAKEVCDDGVDNNGDGKADSADPACSAGGGADHNAEIAAWATACHLSCKGAKDSRGQPITADDWILSIQLCEDGADQWNSTECSCTPASKVDGWDKEHRIVRRQADIDDGRIARSADARSRRVDAQVSGGEYWKDGKKVVVTAADSLDGRQDRTEADLRGGEYTDAAGNKIVVLDKDSVHGQLDVLSQDARRTRSKLWGGAYITEEGRVAVTPVDESIGAQAEEGRQAFRRVHGYEVHDRDGNVLERHPGLVDEVAEADAKATEAVSHGFFARLVAGGFVVVHMPAGVDHDSNALTPDRIMRGGVSGGAFAGVELGDASPEGEFVIKVGAGFGGQQSTDASLQPLTTQTLVPVFEIGGAKRFNHFVLGVRYAFAAEITDDLLHPTAWGIAPLGVTVEASGLKSLGENNRVTLIPFGGFTALYELVTARGATNTLPGFKAFISFGVKVGGGPRRE